MADEIRYAACTLFLIYITIEIFAIIKLPMIFKDIILILGNKVSMTYKFQHGLYIISFN